MYDPIPEATERVASLVLDAAFCVHKSLGPGLLESVYEVCLCHELAKFNVPFKKQLNLPVKYDGLRLESGLRIDVLAADCVVIELKAVEKLLPLHEAQLLTYMKLSQKRLGILINFNVKLLKDGIRRKVL